MIGLALVVFVTVFASGIKSSVAKTIDESFRSDVILQNTDGFSPIPRGAVEAARDAEGVATVSSISYSAGRTKGKDVRVAGEVEGELDLLGNVVVGEREIVRLFGARQPSIAFARLAPGANSGDVKEAVEGALDKRFPTVEVRNQDEVKENQERQVNSLLGLIYALLSLAIIVSLFGIVNTLALSIHERTRELGMLRAVGMSRRQVRTMVRYEAVITALIGALLGTVLGVVFAVLVSRPLADEGFELSYPIR